MDANMRCIWLKWLHEPQHNSIRLVLRRDPSPTFPAAIGQAVRGLERAGRDTRTKRTAGYSLLIQVTTPAQHSICITQGPAALASPGHQQLERVGPAPFIRVSKGA